MFIILIYHFIIIIIINFELTFHVCPSSIHFTILAMHVLEINIEYGTYVLIFIHQLLNGFV